MEMKKHRKRVQLVNLEKIKPRSNDYLRLRYHWLRELTWIRAKCRNGTATKRDLKAAQQALARVRLEP